MKGRMYFIPTSGEIEITDLDAVPALHNLQELVGGYLQLVPMLNSFATSEGVRHCVVFCDEDGKNKDLPRNTYVNQFWSMALPEVGLDYLVGPVVILTGDPEFMNSI